jgi:hypothetical protein
MSICRYLKWLSWCYPDLRIGQLISNAISDAGMDLIYITDEVLLDKLIEYGKR